MSRRTVTVQGVELDVHPIALSIALALAAHGIQKRSLSPFGALTALVFGYLCLANPQPIFGVLVIVHYLVGSRATKYKAAVKATLEDSPEYRFAVEAKAKGGKTEPQEKKAAGAGRTGTQVLCNLFLAAVGAVAWRALFSGETKFDVDLLDIKDPPTWTSEGWCAVDEKIANQYSRFLVFMAIGYMATCLGDTLASELGILSKSQPLLITTREKVHPGTNGGVTPWGLLCSLIGGGIIAITSVTVLLLTNKACTFHDVWDILLWGTGAGFYGSFIDSLAGAFFQETVYDFKQKKVIHGIPPDAKDEDLDIYGYPILSNNAVNLLSATFTGLLMAYTATLTFG